MGAATERLDGATDREAEARWLTEVRRLPLRCTGSHMTLWE